MSQIKYESNGIIHSPFKQIEDMPIQPAAVQGVAAK